MRIVIAIDSFKGSLSSAQGADALAAGLLDADPALQILKVPIADGGEGTLEALARACEGRLVSVETFDPLERPRRAAYLLLSGGETAVVELAAASGLTLLAPAERDPLAATTRGTGVVIRRAIDDGARRIILTVGGSATNDGGTGIAVALGAKFLDDRGGEVPPRGGDLVRIRAVDTEGVPLHVAGVEITIATDVSNPLCGPAGAARVYGPQKGASPSAVRVLDEGLKTLGEVLERHCGRAVASLPGAGAAGGTAASLVALFGARLVSGFETIAALAGLEREIAGAGLVITGEGRVDAQTLQGKVPLGVARLARRAGVPVMIVGGEIRPEAEALREEGVCGFFPIVSGPVSRAKAMSGARELMRATGRRIGYVLGFAAKQRERADR
ncbi:MAG TPA: glycerate kinase [Planctomycetota bacterium]|jgi:glycerate kinase|nr:glycerate kinase [Planctomycetota bacterium]OQC21921.1 MAG: Glycerate kinase [Planctomycetes bacterium ADurb.Bin069]HNS00019.1 glycerate kinase [Planctomycetota bacterium]HNU27041.1 glycerate kinase [Planctomycetota bacterium]HOE29606.1 glycerate kinase [Planctomycetota bacterium]